MDDWRDLLEEQERRTRFELIAIKVYLWYTPATTSSLDPFLDDSYLLWPETFKFVNPMLQAALAEAQDSSVQKSESLLDAKAQKVLYHLKSQVRLSQNCSWRTLALTCACCAKANMRLYLLWCCICIAYLCVYC